MNIKFTKMHGLGNDFMVIDGINQAIHLSPTEIAQWSRRDTGVGFDQCLVIEESHQKDIDFFYRVFNANGQEVAQCGNGARCLARFVHQYRLSNKQNFRISTHTTQMQLQINDDETVTVEFGKPKLNPGEIPIQMEFQSPYYAIPLEGNNACEVHAINVGNPHAVIVVPNIKTADVDTLGKYISEHSLFPEKTNVGFMHLLDTSHINLRVYERGCAETQACGSGAIAAVAIGRLYHQLEENVTVSLPGGDLKVHWPSVDGAIFLTGPAEFVYEGSLLCAL